MPPSPQRTAAHALRRVFSAGHYLDDDPREWDGAAEGEGLVHDDEDLDGGFGAEGLRLGPRVASRVESNADGSAEAVLSADASSDSRARPNNDDAAASSGWTGAPPLARTQSTPRNFAAGARHRGGPGTLAYAMRRVFSREESSEWTRPEEAEGLVAPPSANRVSSHVSSHVAAMGSGAEEEEGAELVLDEEYDDVDLDEGRVESSLFGEDDTRSKRVQKKGGYALRRFLSAPHKKSLRPSAVKRTPSYDREAHNERISPLYRTEPHMDSSQLSGPVGLARTLSFRRKRSTPDRVDTMLKDDDLSTVAESVDSSSVASPARGRAGRPGRREGKKPRIRPAMAVAVGAFVVVALALAGVGIYLTVDRSDARALDNGQMEYASLGDGGEAVLEDGADGASGADETDEMLDAAASEDEDGTWASRDETDASAEPPSEPQGEYEKGTDAYSEYDQAPDPSEGKESEEKPEAAAEENDAGDAAPPLASPSATSVAAPIPLAAVAATSTPTSKPTEDTYTKFYLMADCPYDDNERENLMPGYIDDLSTDAEFLVHLGDLQYAKVDDCREYAYRSARKIMKRSPIPAFVLPGDNDINDCDDHEHGEDMWLKYFHKIDEEWDHAFDVTRWGKLDESFSFLHKGVLYFGLNIVGGSPYSKTEKRKRHAEHLERIREIVEGLDEDDFQVVVLLGHADPGDNHDDFFKGDDGFAAIVEGLGKPTVHFHGDWHEYYEVEGDFGVDNYMRISLDGESIAPPIEVEIDVSKENPVRVSRRRRDLDVDCCRRGWPRHDEL